MSERRISIESPSSTPDAESPHRKQSRKANRIRFACLRCQKRKIKCDGATPACSPCRKAGAACVDGAKQHERYSKAYITSLQDRIRWLEDQLVSHCPEVDLSNGPRVVRENNAQDGDTLHDTSTVDAHHSMQDPGSLEQSSIADNGQPERLAHEIGLVSVTGGQDLRYVGPSSGYSFAKLLFASIGRRNVTRRQAGYTQPIPTLASEAFQVPLAQLPSSLEHAVQLSKAYWDTIHCQYPFLHQPNHMKLLERVYISENPCPVVAFQVYMVLAISTTILSRRLKLPLYAEGYCATAMTYFDRIPIEGSLEGLQCLLLLQMYGMHNPSMGLNLWYLNYQCIASVLDLGLQRDVRAGRNLSVLTQEMRTRIFWVVYSLDRTLATIMGRPIGLRDEGCDLRLPADMDDDSLLASIPSPRIDSSPPTFMTNAIHLIKLSGLNSEIKYIANSVSHKTPAYTYPQIPNIMEWQDDILGRLQQWAAAIPKFDQTQSKLSEIKHHEVRMLLLRPSPAIPGPSHESLHLCHESAIATIRAFDQLYRGDFLVFNWQTLHSVFLATVTMLYCIWTVPTVTRNTAVEMLIADLKTASSVLSALAEHFVDAKRGRDVLDELSSVTIRWMMDSQKHGRVAPRSTTSTTTSLPDNAFNPENSLRNQGDQNGCHRTTGFETSNNIPTLSQSLDDILNTEPWDSLFGISDESSFPLQIDSIMQGVFNDFQPDFEFGQSSALDNLLTDEPIL